MLISEKFYRIEFGLLTELTRSFRFAWAKCLTSPGKFCFFNLFSCEAISALWILANNFAVYSIKVPKAAVLDSVAPIPSDVVNSLSLSERSEAEVMDCKSVNGSAESFLDDCALGIEVEGAIEWIGLVWVEQSIEMAILVGEWEEKEFLGLFVGDRLLSIGGESTLWAGGIVSGNNLGLGTLSSVPLAGNRDGPKLKESGLGLCFLIKEISSTSLLLSMIETGLEGGEPWER